MRQLIKLQVFYLIHIFLPVSIPVSFLIVGLITTVYTVYQEIQDISNRGKNALGPRVQNKVEEDPPLHHIPAVDNLKPL